MKRIVKLEQPSCRPCVFVGNFLDDQGVQYEKVDVTVEPEVAARFGIMSTPVTILLDGDTELKRVAGFNPPELEEMIEELNK